MPTDSSPPSPDPRAAVLSPEDLRALTRFIEQSLGHGFRLAIVEAATRARREAILKVVAAPLGDGLLRLSVAELPGAADNVWQALQKRLAGQTPRCLALWNIEGNTVLLRQLNVQRDLFVRDIAVPWLLFIHPATRVPLLQTAPDFCDFAILWIREEAPPFEFWHKRVSVTHSAPALMDVTILAESPLLSQAQTALFAARFDEARDLLSQFDLQPSPPVADRLIRQLLGARFERERGHLALAEALLKGIQESLHQLGPGPERQALNWLVDSDLGRTLDLAGRYPEAEVLLRSALAGHEEALGKDHPSYGTAQQGLAVLLTKQGRYVDAESLLRDSLKIYEQALGKDHPSYRTTLHALAAVLGYQGKFGDAEALLRASLKVYEKALPKEHPSYGTALHVLAWVLYHQGQYVEVESLLQASLRIYEKAREKDHPILCPTLANLAQALVAQGRPAEGEAHAQRALQIAQRAFGLQHPDTGQCLLVLAEIQAAQGAPQAIATARQAVDVLRISLGEEHPITQDATAVLLSMEQGGSPPEPSRTEVPPSPPIRATSG